MSRMADERLAEIDALLTPHSNYFSGLRVETELFAALKAERSKVAELELKLAPDYALTASLDALREHMQLLGEAQKRIAELDQEVRELREWVAELEEIMTRHTDMALAIERGRAEAAEAVLERIKTLAGDYAYVRADELQAVLDKAK